MQGTTLKLRLRNKHRTELNPFIMHEDSDTRIEQASPLVRRVYRVGQKSEPQMLYACEQPGSPGFRSVFRTASFPRNHSIQHLVHEAFRHRGQLRRKGFP